MGDWRRSSQGGQGLHYHVGGGPTRPPKYGRLPPPAGSWQPTVPSWEKKFCTSVCSIPWKQLCETRRVMSMYKNVVQWNDSAGEEAFQNAKARFWAEINGFPCDTPLPSPDIYIDEIDWDSTIDPNLVEDLEKESPLLDDGDKDPKLSFLSNGWDSLLFLDIPVPCTGWGDAEDPVPTTDNAAEPQSTGWDINDESGNAWNCSGGWADGVPQDNVRGSERGSSWDNGRDSSCGHWENRSNEMDRNYGRKRDGGCHFGTRYTNSRYAGDDYQTNSSRRNCRGRKKANYPHEQSSAYVKQPLATQQWNRMQSCGPMNHQGSSAWHWEKRVS